MCIRDRYETRIEREQLAAQKSVKKLNDDKIKRELAALTDEKAAERKLIKKYEQHMQKSKEKVEKAIALRIQAEKQKKKDKKAAEKAALRWYRWIRDWDTITLGTAHNIYHV